MKNIYTSLWPFSHARNNSVLFPFGTKLIKFATVWWSIVFKMDLTACRSPWAQDSWSNAKVSIRWASWRSAAALFKLMFHVEKSICYFEFIKKLYLKTDMHSVCSALSARSRGVNPKWSLAIKFAPASTRTDTLDAWPCSAATCRAVRPSARGPETASWNFNSQKWKKLWHTNLTKERFWMERKPTF